MESDAFLFLKLNFKFEFYRGMNRYFYIRVSCKNLLVGISTSLRSVGVTMPRIRPRGTSWKNTWKLFATWKGTHHSQSIDLAIVIVVLMAKATDSCYGNRSPCAERLDSIHHHIHYCYFVFHRASRLTVKICASLLT